MSEMINFSNHAQAQADAMILRAKVKTLLNYGYQCSNIIGVPDAVWQEFLTGEAPALTGRSRPVFGDKTLKSGVTARYSVTTGINDLGKTDYWPAAGQIGKFFQAIETANTAWGNERQKFWHQPFNLRLAHPSGRATMTGGADFAAELKATLEKMAALLEANPGLLGPGKGV